MAYRALTHEISERRHGNLPCHVNKPDIGYTSLGVTKELITERTFARPSRKRKSRQGVGDNLSVCVLNLLPKILYLPSLETISLMKVEIQNF